MLNSPSPLKCHPDSNRMHGSTAGVRSFTHMSSLKRRPFQPNLVKWRPSSGAASTHSNCLAFCPFLLCCCIIHRWKSLANVSEISHNVLQFGHCLIDQQGLEAGVGDVQSSLKLSSTRSYWQQLPQCLNVICQTTNVLSNKRRHNSPSKCIRVYIRSRKWSK